MKEKQVGFKKEIGLFGGISVLTGIMVGSGIFFIGSYVLMSTGYSIGLSLLVWLIGGLITLMYGLIYAELGAMFPLSGGYYIYLKRAYGRPVAFMSGFMNFALASSGSIAGLAIAFSLILSNVILVIFGVITPNWLMTMISIILIIGISFLNYFGIKIGTTVLKVFMVIKAIPLFTIIILGLMLGTQRVDLSISLNGHSIFSVLSMIGIAVIATFWAYEGWTNLNSVAEEIHQPGRNLPLSLIITIASVTALYVLYNFSLFRVLSLTDIRGMLDSAEPNIYIGIPAAMQILGSIGMYVVMISMLISVFGALVGTIMTFPRVYYAMAKDDAFIRKFSVLHPKYRTPYAAIFGSMIMSLILLVFQLQDLITLVAFGAMVFNIMIFISIFIFRKREPETVRPYKVWGYPWLPIIAIGITSLLIISAFIESIVPSLIGTIIILAGLPIYYLFEYLNRKQS